MGGGFDRMMRHRQSSEGLDRSETDLGGMLDVNDGGGGGGGVPVGGGMAAADQYSVDHHGNYYAAGRGTAAGSSFSSSSSSSTTAESIAHHQAAAAPPPPPPPPMWEMDYCDAILRGMDDPSFSGWLAGAFGGGGGGTSSSAASRAANGGGYGNLGGGGGTMMQQLLVQPGGGGGYGTGETMAFPLCNGVRGGLGSSSSSTSPSSSGGGRITIASGLSLSKARSAAEATTITSSTRLSPNQSDHSSLPSAQIDPILERISLTVTAVSLTPLSGNEVVRHIRTKTDDVITRFLPCVEFLVNCQQELRQGLQLAQNSGQRRRISGVGGRSRAGNGMMTPRQFHTTYVAPLPRRFERQNECLMAREHLLLAASSLESLVRDAAAAMPQGCDHVKNAFLGGMRENESWGLRKWLSKHGGAGSICNDLEEVMRHVKALRKEDETTKRLAEMLRPIARQAHERLKKDVPQAYQERSSAHPYLPFFHRLEACLKLMATYDPEEDDVICLPDSSDEEEDDIKVLSTSPVKSRVAAAPPPVAAIAQSSPVKKRNVITSKRKCDDSKDIEFFSKWVESYTAESGEDVNSLKRSKVNSENKYADKFFGERNEDDTDDCGNKVEKKTKAKEAEIICLDDSDEDDDENDTNTVKVQNSGLDLKPDSDQLESSSAEPIEAARLSQPLEMQDYSQTYPPHSTSKLAMKSAETEIPSIARNWRCNQCTFLNEAFATKCVMCNDDDSPEGGDASDELANFLSESSFHSGISFNLPDPFA
ncbi:hypothetical protein ACHAXA_009698 [Cyclostephanos tholiformis]|uniref:RanBP2-type domain-containing protein n=1 Tax=Cyclostephanos tholiformis TaxID=382380 RepID=A0ABD3R496_9STRA